MGNLTIRYANPSKDADACAAIYAPHVSASPTSFEESPPSVNEMAKRIASLSATHLLEHLRAQRFRTACAGITLPNDASVALHERMGFVSVGIYRKIGWKAGEWRDVGWWQLDLDPNGADPPAEPLSSARGSP